MYRKSSEAGLASNMGSQPPEAAIMQQSGRGNRVRWTPGTAEASGHVESYFLKLNDPAQGFALWLKFTFLVPQDGRAPVFEVWGVWFDMDDPTRTRAWKTTQPLTSQLVLDPDLHLLMPTPLGPCELTNRSTRGVLDDAAHRLEWDLTFDAGQDALRHLPWRWMYEKRLPRSKILAPHPASRFSGHVRIDGRLYTVDRAIGTQGHNWGSEHAWHYAWGHCALFDGMGPDTFFEGFSSRLKLGPWVTPPLSVAHLSLEGQRHAFDRWRSMRSRLVSLTNRRWQFRLENDTHALEGVLEAPLDDFICLHYRNPDDSLAHCLNSKLASGELTLRDRHERPIKRLVTYRGAALEVLTRDPSHGVRFGA